MKRFWVAPFLPAGLLAAACFFGGWWSVAALISVTALVLGMDRWWSPGNRFERAEDIRTGHLITLTLGLAHLALLPLGVWALTEGEALHGMQAGFTAVALGLFFGQVSNSTAHELIHRTNRWARRLGIAIFSSLLFGHHATAHPLVHHIYVATPRDPNSAPMGMGFYRFWPRAWIGSFQAGLAAENKRRRGCVKPTGLHPYVVYVGGALASLAFGWIIGGLPGLLVWIGLATYASMQLILSDYVQHYALRRARTSEGGWVRADLGHSWNAPHRYSSAFMLNAPRHSDHHANPARSFPNLRLDPKAMPMLPHSLPVIAAIALIPPLWRRVMDARAHAWTQPNPSETQIRQDPVIAVGSS